MSVAFALYEGLGRREKGYLFLFHTNSCFESVEFIVQCFINILPDTFLDMVLFLKCVLWVRGGQFLKNGLCTLFISCGSSLCKISLL